MRCETADNASAKKLVSGKRDPLDVVVATDYDHLDVLPADLSYRKFDVHLSRRDFPTEWLLKMRHALSRSCETLFMDYPAGISLLSENVPVRGGCHRSSARAHPAVAAHADAAP